MNDDDRIRDFASLQLALLVSDIKLDTNMLELHLANGGTVLHYLYAAVAAVTARHDLPHGQAVVDELFDEIKSSKVLLANLKNASRPIHILAGLVLSRLTPELPNDGGGDDWSRLLAEAKRLLEVAGELGGPLDACDQIQDAGADCQRLAAIYLRALQFGLARGEEGEPSSELRLYVEHVVRRRPLEALAEEWGHDAPALRAALKQFMESLWDWLERA